MDLVKALGLVLVVGAVVWLVMALIDAMGVSDDREIDELTLDAIETLRQIIERDTGREVAELFLHGDHWHAVTSRGPVLVSELLKSGYVRVGVK